ncbi:MAG: bifunctional 5,10-methylenetetrahydrofolate dehydrogenase/5,10-methenyltetrahydrofolate cyclohydrolase [Candidatus Portnoybacteria bacterium]|nr:bifunctional 5,10-methylenetetrahydrofolate dehydrogenase/5,10-methenyltetrahydrofolate cyclohydrolase [Candidatus Portnoybacteria bacterium]
MRIIDGKKIASKILADLKKEIEKKKLKPCLAVILVGDNPVSLLYVQKKEQAAQKIGIEIRKYNLSKQTSEKEILEIIDSLNQDSQINGILVQLPLPNHLAADKIIQAIRPAKDVDGFVKNSRFKSPFILAVERALQETGQDLTGKKAVALVNSDIFGQVLKSQLKKLEFIKDLKKADIIITALGQANCIKGDMIKERVILIDGGISKQNGKVVGDIDQESVKDKAKWLSPVPGGLGPLTVAFLLRNIIKAVP